MLWIPWIKIVCELRPAFSHRRTFCWAVITLIGLTVRSDMAGVTSLVRATGIRPKFYQSLLDFFHSSAIDLELLTSLWASLCLKLFSNKLTKFNGRVVLLADGIKVAKSGRKMPGVKLLYQSSSNNNKAPFFMGHSCQAVSLLVNAGKSHLAVPLVTRIHEGPKRTNRDKNTLIDKLVNLIKELGIGENYYLVADAYYAAQGIANGIDGHLITRVKSNAVAYQKHEGPHAGPGRRKFYGKKTKLQQCFINQKAFQSAESPVYGEKGVTIRYQSMDLIWRGLGRVVRFVLVDHPSRGRCILLSTDLELTGLQIIELYGLRFKIEVGFKQAVHQVGTFAYRFWMRSMKRSSRGKGTEYLHRAQEEYRAAFLKKFQAYQVHIQLGVIAQGLLQYLSVFYSTEVWSGFKGWLRTIRPGIAPSEQVVSMALRAGLLEFFMGNKMGPELKEFLEERVDLASYREFRLAS